MRRTEKGARLTSNSKKKLKKISEVFKTFQKATLAYLGFAALCILGLFIYQFFDPALSRSRENKRHIKNITEQLNTLTNQVNALINQVTLIITYIDTLILNPTSIFGLVSDIGTGQVLSAVPQQITNDGSGPLTQNIDGLYNSTSMCVGGYKMEINDTVIVKVEVTGISTGLLSLSMQAVLCDFSPMFGQGLHGQLNFVAALNQTYEGSIFFTWTNEIEDAGGVTLLMLTSGGSTFNVSYVQYLITRQRTLPPLALI